MPYIRVSEFVKRKLEDVKVQEQHTSMDSVLRSLLKRWENNHQRR